MLSVYFVCTECALLGLFSTHAWYDCVYTIYGMCSAYSNVCAVLDGQLVWRSDGAQHSTEKETCGHREDCEGPQGQIILSMCVGGGDE